MRKALILLSLFIIKTFVHAQLADRIELTNDQRLIGLGTQRILKSEILQEDRPVIISLPNGYEESQAGYPVFYVLDGLQNIKHTIGTVELLTESGLIPPLIIVGIESLDRSRDLTPSRAGENMYGGAGNAGIPQSGGAPSFLQFMKEELIPFVETSYRTHPYRILEGHSFGGLFSVFALMDSPEIFDALIIEAPALWWNNEEMTQKAEEFFTSHAALEKTVYFGIGGNDGWGMRQELKRFVDVIEESQPEHFRWFHEEVGDEDHMASRLLLNYYGLKFIFADLRISDSLTNNYQDSLFLKNENQLIQKYGPKTRRPAGDYVNLVAQQLDAGNSSGAITILKTAIAGYPKYIGLLTYLARIYEQTNQIEKAISTYELAIEVSKKYKLGQEQDLLIAIESMK